MVCVDIVERPRKVGNKKMAVFDDMEWCVLI